MGNQSYNNKTPSPINLHLILTTHPLLSISAIITRDHRLRGILTLLLQSHNVSSNKFIESKQNQLTEGSIFH